ncbi:DciA family protein [Wenzhouxiangella limi]|uniref:DUF721 domain-containing protein n=1 Tax=Wenzhouxiangella limi TaxID=2707351 RepID=A0A845VHL6_9GAMM|nr:DciA family protein [Wenzhouxiangella limi]NDY96679.1 DUF721 domain-containing protein [Wenzhouxiangella limi]
MKQGAEKLPIDIVAGSNPLQRLVRAQRVFEALDAKIQPALSQAVRGRIRVACVDGETLVLAADSPVWASRARLEADHALEIARTVWPEALTKVRVIVATGSG